GHFTRVTSAGISEFFSYNGLGQLSGVVQSTGQRLTLRYGADGRMRELSDVQGNRIRLQRDTEGTLVSRTLLNPDGSIAQTTNLSLLDIEADRKSGAQRDGAVPDILFAADNTVTRFQYDQQSRLARVTDARKHQTDQTFDDFGRLVRVGSPDGGVTVLAYDAADHLVSKTTGHGSEQSKTVSFRHDVAGRVTGQRTEEGDTRIVYGQQGRPVRISYPAGEEQFSYDHAARLTSHVRLIDQQRVETRYAYDGRGQLLRKTLPDGQILHYRYNGAIHAKAGLLTAITREDLFGNTVLLDGLNDADDRYANQQYQLANGANYQRQLDQTGHITRIGSVGNWEEQHQRDTLGQLTQRNATESTGKQSTRYGYDLAGRMTGVTHVGDDRSSRPSDHAYRYDQTGNLLADGRGTLSTGYTIDPASNRITAAQADDRNIPYDYNAAGSITRTGDADYLWDSQQRLIRVSQHGQPVADYAYNAFGERIKKVSYAGGQKAVTYYFYDGSELVAEAQGSPKDAGGNHSSTATHPDSPSSITRQYVWLDDQSGSRPIAMLQARDSGITALAGQALNSIPTDTTRAIGQATRNDVFAIVADHTGAPRALINDRKHVVWRSSVTGFGELIPDANAAMPLNLRGSNQYYDAESGLHYNHHRYLDVRSGRYLSADPSGLSGGLNLYAFADNNPVANVDPLGLQAKPVVDVSGWDTQQRVEYVLLRAGSQIPGVIGDMLRELVKPESLRTTAIVFGVWAGSQLTPIGPAVDAALAVAGYYFFGKYAVIAAEELFKAAVFTLSAKCEADLQKAGDLLASGLMNALGAGAALVGSAQALRTEKVQALLWRVFSRVGSGTNSAALAATRASVDDKLFRYLLNADHPIGGSKAKWFDSALGFNRSNADQLAKQIVFNETVAVQTAVIEQGVKFNQVIPITGANGKVIDVTFGWIRNKDDIVRLTTAIPTKK
ncbi:RHS repeat-associated core domain-containing protein, partial [Actimicrobium antarcticum]|uniref:RHS repeat-associated core domain-containing protein n=1 Tax=Actimicrobium antarcticum TaxID=1051899 RepID=UPI0031DBF027